MIENAGPAQLGARSAYASNAFGALAIGFGGAAAVTSGLRGLRAMNGIAALLCGAAAFVLRAVARETPLAYQRDAELATDPCADALDYSIVVPVYNRPKALASLLARLATQAGSWNHLGRGEIIIVDDGSADDTAAVADSLARAMPFPTRVVSIPHGGPSAARNAGFTAARGTIGVALDSDCLPDDDWLETMLAAVRADPRAVAFAQIRSPGTLAYPIENMPDCKGFVSASFAMDRFGFCKIGGFCLEYDGVSHEDLDFVETAKSNGYAIVRTNAHIDHPLRRETAASLWRVGLNSRSANLFARRHGLRAAGLTRTTPYYFFGVAGNYGSSIAILVAAANAAAVLVIALAGKSLSGKDARHTAALFAGAGSLYALALAVLGVRVGAGPKRLPSYMTALASFQLATLCGRLRGSLQYGVILL